MDDNVRDCDSLIRVNCFSLDINVDGLPDHIFFLVGVHAERFCCLVCFDYGNEENYEDKLITAITDLRIEQPLHLELIV